MTALIIAGAVLLVAGGLIWVACAPVDEVDIHHDGLGDPRFRGDWW